MLGDKDVYLFEKLSLTDNLCKHEKSTWNTFVLNNYFSSEVTHELRHVLCKLLEVFEPTHAGSLHPLDTLFGHQPQPKLGQYVLKIVCVNVFPGRACDPVLNLNRSIQYKY